MSVPAGTTTATTATTPPENTGAPPAGTPPAGEGGGAPPATGDTGTPPEPSQTPAYDAAYVANLRKESGDMRKALREAQAKLKEIEDANLSETEKLRKEVEALRQESAAHRQARREAEVLTAAAKAGAKRPEVVAKLVPADAEDLTATLETLRKEYPEFFGATHGSADGGAGTPAATGNAGGGTGTPKPPAKMSDQIRAAVRGRLMGGG